jgi:hypothetical protein
MPPGSVLATAAGFLSAQFLGALWYGPLLFGKRWVEAMKSGNEKFKPEPKPGVMLWAAVVWLVSSVMYSRVVQLSGAESFPGLAQLSVAAWAAFAVPQHAFGVIFEGRSPEVALIGASYALSSYLLMAACHAFL